LISMSIVERQFGKMKEKRAKELKTLCMSENVLNDLLTQLCVIPCRVLFCEMDKVHKVTCWNIEIPLVEYFDVIEEHFRTKISSFALMDLGELGSGYVFYIK
jgi:hypothetical protein